MLLSQYPPLNAKHLPLDLLRVSELLLARERRLQKTRAHQRVGMLLSQYAPPRIKHLPVDPLCVSVLPLAQEQIR